MENKKYIILEIVPSSLYAEKGEVLQLSAIKLNGFALIDRFDKRIVAEKVPFAELEKLISYDKEQFVYKNTSKEIMETFKNWIEDYNLLYINNAFTENYLNYYDVTNNKQPVFELLHMEYSDNVVEKMLEKYNLQPSNYVVDLIFEALINEENNKMKK